MQFCKEIYMQYWRYETVYRNNAIFCSLFYKCSQDLFLHGVFPFNYSAAFLSRSLCFLQKPLSRFP